MGKNVELHRSMDVIPFRKMEINLKSLPIKKNYCRISYDSL